MSDLKTLKDLKLEEDFAEYLAFQVYHPVKEELKGCGRTYSLGQRLEFFKGFVEKKHKELRQAAIDWIKREDWSDYSETQMKIIRPWIKEFFNITEEELQ